MTEPGSDHDAVERRLRQLLPEYAQWADARNCAYAAMLAEAKARHGPSCRADAVFRLVAKKLRAWDRRNPCPVTAWDLARAQSAAEG